MSNILQYSPGQTVTIALQILNSLGERADGYDGYDGYVDFVLFPNLMAAAGYPAPMTHINTGLYVFHFTLPTGATAVGTYLASVFWLDPDTSILKQDLYQIVVSAPFGIYSVSPG